MNVTRMNCSQWKKRHHHRVVAMSKSSALVAAVEAKQKKKRMQQKPLGKILLKKAKKFSQFPSLKKAVYHDILHGYGKEWPKVVITRLEEIYGSDLTNIKVKGKKFTKIKPTRRSQRLMDDIYSDDSNDTTILPLRSQEEDDEIRAMCDRRKLKDRTPPPDGPKLPEDYSFPSLESLMKQPEIAEETSADVANRNDEEENFISQEY